MKSSSIALLLTASFCSATYAENNFGQDVAFLKKHSDAVVLSRGNAKIIVVPQWQGRVMTSTATGLKGNSYGWINYAVIKKGIVPEKQRKGLEKHIYIFGGEERLWLGPEGGQFGIFFKPNESNYTFANWKTPPVLDTESFDVTSSSESKISFTKEATLQNNSGTTLKVKIDRSVKVLSPEDINSLLGIAIPDGVQSIAFESSNTLTNRGKTSWTKDKGLLSIWMLGMLKHSPDGRVVIPLKPGKHNAVNSDYFEKPGSDRVQIKGNLVYFKVDGKKRTKIGIPPQRTKNYCGSYDPTRHTLTVVQFNLPANPEKLPYVRSQWKHHEHPYAGDVINSYNDGSPKPGAKPLGPFYELETSSPALPLAPGKSITHIQRTMHFQGNATKLDIISKKLFGVSVKEITNSLKK